MSRDVEPIEDAVGQIWRLLCEEPVAMVGTPFVTRPMRPMTVHPAPDECALWFFALADGSFAREVGEGGPSHLVAVSRDGRSRAALVGRVEPSDSTSHVDRYWNAAIAARFEAEKGDPAVALLRFTPQIGRLWVAAAPLATGWELAVAPLSGRRPHLEDGVEVVFTPPI